MTNKEEAIRTLVDEFTKKLVAVVCDTASRYLSPRGPVSGSGRVLRGGGWRSFPGYLRSAQHNYNSPGIRDSNLGFRLVRTKNAESPRGPDSGSVRVFRGGSWVAFARSLRSARRNGSGPGLRINGVGFRLVRTRNIP